MSYHIDSTLTIYDAPEWHVGYNRLKRIEIAHFTQQTVGYFNAF